MRDLTKISKVEAFGKMLEFWPNLTEAEKALLIDNTYPAAYASGEMIHGGDGDCLGIMLVESGDVRVYMLSEDGREITLYRLHPGDVCVLSSSCVLNEITFDVHIDADSDCELLIINSKIYSELVDTNIYVENFTLKEAMSRFSDVMWAMQQILFMSLDKRLASFMMDEIARSGQLEIQMTHDQIAKYISSAREVVSRMLKYFAQEGIVELSRGKIIIKDKNKLKKLTGIIK